MAKINIKKGWIGGEIKGVREAPERGTYHPFDFDELPPIPHDLAEDFSWLLPMIRDLDLKHKAIQFMEDQKVGHAEKGRDFSAMLVPLERELNSLNISLPQAVKTFLSNPSINSRVRSSTDNYFEMPDFIETIVADKPYHVLHFMSDSQYCMLWYLCFDQVGRHFVIASPFLFGHREGEGDKEDLEELPIAYYCAHSFEEFIYRYNLEQRIWYKLHWFEAELAEEEKIYVDHYRHLNKMND